MASSNAEPLGPSTNEPYRGMKIGRYDVLTQLSVGGMAELFLGYTAGPGGFRKYVAIKKILPDARDNDQFVKMFLDEARITAAFSHPNIGQVFELGRQDNELFLAMEFISGQNLNQVTAACAQKRAVLPIGFSAAVAHDLGLALHYAHTFVGPDGAALPVIHRDVAQKNVMVTYDGVVKLLDFGIAKARGSLGRTHTGTVKGTTGYMSPEQVRGDELDGRSDVFSLGVVLFEMVTGQRLFAAETELDEMKLILTGPIPQPHQLVPVVPEALSDIVMRALARERTDRFNSAKDFSRALTTSCPDLLFDQDQRATFMAEHFTEKMKATQALLQSAAPEVSGAPDVVASALKHLREEPGAASPAPRLSKGAVKVARVRSRRKRDTDEQSNSGASAITSPAAVATPTDAPTASSLGWLVPLVVLAVVVGGGAALFKSLFIGPELPTAAVEPVDGPVPTPPGLPAPIPEFGADRPAPPPLAPEAAADAKDPKKKAPGARTGQFTLVTFPDATVWRGKMPLGKTPLFNAELPLGTHVLTLVGPDGQKHVLSMPVSSGKPTAMKVNLDELPTR